MVRLAEIITDFFNSIDPKRTQAGLRFPQTSRPCEGMLSYARSAPRLPGRNTDRETSMRAIGLVSLIIAMMALLLTDADAPRRRSSAQWSQTAGASRSWCATYPGKGISDNCSYATQQMCLAQVWGLGGFCRPNPFPGTAYGTGYTWGSRPR